MKQGLIRKLVKIERECNRNDVLNDKMEAYIREVGEPTSKNDAIKFIEHFNKVKQSIKNTG